MLTLRRASLSFRVRGLGIWASSADSGQHSSQTHDPTGIVDSSALETSRCLPFNGFYRNKHASSANLFGVRRRLASHAGAESSGEEKDELDDVFSELEREESAKAVPDPSSQHDEELISEPEFSDDDEEVDVSDDVPSKQRSRSGLLKMILAAQGAAIHAALNKWVEDGNEIDREEVTAVMVGLRKFRKHGKALTFSEWLEGSKTYEFSEKDYSSRLNLIGKIRGLEKAENYIDQIPKSFRGELVSNTFLATCVQALNSKKAEEVFKKIREEFTLTTFSCNQMILLYQRTDSRKVADVLLMMEKENVKPSLYTYQMLIDMKGKLNDIAGMEQIVETMNFEGVQPSTKINYIIARHYASAGFEEKAEAVIKKMEGDDILENRNVCRVVIQLYGELGRADEVERIWKAVSESKPWPGECLATIEAWGRLKQVEKAEHVFEKMLTVIGNPSSLHYNVLLRVYTNNKMLTKGKDLIRRMAEKDCRVGPVTWDLLIKLYIACGDIGKADSVLQNASQQNTIRPMFISYMTVMEHYARNGDIHNAEKIFHQMKETGYQPRIRQFQTLVKAYVTAKVPLYGIRERMKAENLYPTRGMLGQLEMVNAFKKTPVLNLID